MKFCKEGEYEKSYGNETMPLFEDFGRRLSLVGQSAVQKTKDVTDIARINAAVAEEERIVSNNYYQIGKLYVAMHPSDYEPEFATQFGAIRESESKLNAYRQQIQKLKGTVRCEKCGAEVSIGAAFCSSCGNPMPVRTGQNDSENSVRCESCGAVVPKNVRFCISCGKPIAQITPAAPDAPRETNSPISLTNAPSPQTEAAERRCPRCGALVEADLSFCSECGTKI